MHSPWVFVSLCYFSVFTWVLCSEYSSLLQSFSASPSHSYRNYGCLWQYHIALAYSFQHSAQSVTEDQKSSNPIDSGKRIIGFKWEQNQWFWNMYVKRQFEIAYLASVICLYWQSYNPWIFSLWTINEFDSCIYCILVKFR